MVTVVPSMFASMHSMQQYAQAHPENVTVTQGLGTYSVQVHGGDFVPDFGPMFWMMGLVFIAAVVLYAAAVVRRLHDTGRSGWWGLMPLSFIVFSMFAMPQVFASAGAGGPDLVLFFALFLSNMLYIVTLIILVVLLAIKSTEGPNRFGGNSTAPA